MYKKDNHNNSNKNKRHRTTTTTITNNNNGSLSSTGVTTTTTSNNNNSSSNSNNIRRRNAAVKNPLAVARRSPPQHQKHQSVAQPTRTRTTTTTSTSDKIWYKKTGAGYHLFAQYYAGQPSCILGITSSTTSSDTTPTTETMITSTTTMTTKSDEGEEVVLHVDPTSPSTRTPLQRHGLSRATKRRKRRKGISVSTTTSSTSSSYQQAAISTEIHTNNGPPAIHPIFQSVVCTRPDLINFFTYLSKPLPLTVRIRNGLTAGQETDIRQKLSDYSHWLEPLSWNERIYQANESSHLTKQTVQQLSPTLHPMLLHATTTGRLARQELGSMLPVIAVMPFLAQGNRVLDLCAAPGNKTLQMAELVGPTGRVRANDVNRGRLEAMQAAITRSGIEIASQIIRHTSYDACHFPLSKEPYDCVLTDVPCSGDGTCRKDGHILQQWTPHVANNLHKLQLDILLHAFDCVKPDGWVVYSTCSINPVENEAVVSAALSSSARKGVTFELVPPPEIPIGHPGCRFWRVADFVNSHQDNTDCCHDANGQLSDDTDDDEMPQLRWHETYEDASKRNMDKAVPTMWPPTLHGSEWPLERCIRLLPHDQNCGGFFVALLHRKKSEH